MAILGLGNVGTAITCAAAAAGYSVEELVVRRAPTARQKTLAKGVGAKLVEWKSWKKTSASVVWICTSDSDIAATAGELAKRWAAEPKRPRLVVHASGALSTRELAGIEALGVLVASVHPFRSFPQPVKNCPQPGQSEPGLLAGSWFGVEGNPAAIKAVGPIVRALGGKMFVVQGKDKALYHSFASLAAPLLISLLTAAEEVGTRAGIPQKTAHELLAKLSGGAHANWTRNGPAKSFSGPISRGDTETIEAHLASLTTVPELERVYRALASYAVGHLPVKRRAEMEAALRSAERES
jgi:predicted short-subunit dehydrogenase-like oxidoreductase (DUF2520 family)